MSKPKLRPQGQTPSASPFLKSNNVKDPGEPVTGPPSTERRSGPKPRSPACPTGRTVIPARPSGRPPQRWRASRARRSPCQPRRRTAEANPTPKPASDKNRLSPGKPAGQSPILSEDASAPGPLPRPAPMNRGIRTPTRVVNTGRNVFAGRSGSTPLPSRFVAGNSLAGTRCVERCGASISTSCPPR